ncbi:MAG: adenylate/guanylate cyclase domain-containing protein [Casimicrobiaceae bacterium]
MCNNSDTVNAATDAARRIRKAATGDSADASVFGLIRGIGIRQVRITCGLILFSYLLSHFTNHALGNVSYAVMSDWLDVHMAFWRHPVVVVVFFTAGITHWSLGLWALYERRQFRYRLPEWTQLMLGLSIPFLLVSHFVGARLQAPLFGRDVYYAQVFSVYLISRPYMEWVQFTLLLVAWVHGCIGLYYWLRLKRFFTRAAPYLLVAATLLPTLALLGLVQGGREVVALAELPEWRALNLSPEHLPTVPQRVVLDEIILWFSIAYASLLGLILAARGARALAERRGGMIALSYPNGVKVSVPKGLSVLEASLRNGIAHASVCGGKARCSTCRIRVVGDPLTLPPPSKRESFVLDRVGASADPAVRLACQLRPDRDIAFFLVFPPKLSAANMRRSPQLRVGEERHVVSMFVDMRGSTRMAEKRLPFDTMFIINRFVTAVSSGIEQAGGQPNQFVGDGILALFGLETGPATASRQAIDAVAKIAANVDQLNRDLAQDRKEPIRYGIGVNGGDVIVGDIGYREHVVFTALGDPVNVAARLQDLTKDFACEAVIAEEVCRNAGLPPDPSATREVTIRGRDRALTVRLAKGASLVSAMAT